MAVAAAVTAALPLSALSIPTMASAADGDPISGVVWVDYDANGRHDTYEEGVKGAEVRAFAPDGTVVGPVTSGADGSYTLPVQGSEAAWRVEAKLPDEDQWKEWRNAAMGSDNRSTVRFVTVPAQNVDFAFHVPSAHVENNPLVYLPMHRFGTASDGFEDTQPSGGAIHYDDESPDSSTPVPTTADLSPASIGATFGSTWQRADSDQETGRLFVSAYMRRHAALGPGGLGAIYEVIPDGADFTAPTAHQELYVNVTDAGIDIGDAYDQGAALDANGVRSTVNNENPTYDWIRDHQAWDRVGRVGLGGIAASPDRSRLFAVNLYHRSLIVIDEDDKSVQEVELDQYFPDSSDLRPFGVSADPLSGRMFLTVTDTAESTQDPNQLRGYVYAFDPSDPSTLTKVLETPALNYPRARVSYQPWRTDARSFPDDLPYPSGMYIQNVSIPVVADVDVLHGNMVIGIRDLSGDLFGANGTFYTGDLTDNRRIAGSRAWGESLYATGNDDGTFTLENNGVAGGVTGAGVADDVKGPGGAGYFDSTWMQFEESLGSSVVVYSRDDGVLTTGLHTAGGSFQVGTRRLYQGTGAHFDPRGAMVIQNNNPLNSGGPPEVTSKGNGLGSMAVLATAAPIEVGNYVWNDLDGDGVQDADEPAIAGSTVNLYEKSSGALVSTVTTDENGNYVFTDLKPNTDYQVCLDNPADYEPGGVLDNFSPTVANKGDQESPDPSLNDSNGIAGPNGFACGDVTTGEAGDNDHSIDFGFVRLAVELGMTKTLTQGPTATGPDQYEAVYDITVTNAGEGRGIYDLFDRPAFSGDLTVEKVVAANTKPGDVPIMGTFTGLGAELKSPENQIADNVSIPSGSEQKYTVTVDFKLADGAVLDGGLKCDPSGDPGSGGALNIAAVTHDGDDIVDDACGPVPHEDPSLDKKILLGNETLGNAPSDSDTLYQGGKPDPRKVKVGDTIRYGLIVRANPNHSASKVVLDDVLPSGLIYNGKYTASQGTYDGDRWTVGDLKAGQEVTLVIEAKVDDGPAGTIVTNEAQLTVDGRDVPDQPNKNPGKDGGRNVTPDDGYDEVDFIIAADAEPAGPIGLPSLGADVMGVLIAALVLLLAGGATVIAVRRRTTNGEIKK